MSIVDITKDLSVRISSFVKNVSKTKLLLGYDEKDPFYLDLSEYRGIVGLYGDSHLQKSLIKNTLLSFYFMTIDFNVYFIGDVTGYEEFLTLPNVFVNETLSDSKKFNVIVILDDFNLNSIPENSFFIHVPIYKSSFDIDYAEYDKFVDYVASFPYIKVISLVYNINSGVKFRKFVDDDDSSNEPLKPYSLYFPPSIIDVILNKGLVSIIQHYKGDVKNV